MTKPSNFKPLSMDFSGERLIPNIPELENLYQEHIIRYMFASTFVKSKIVLDAGCGTGYGPDLLAQNGAKKVVAIDNSNEAIDFCTKNYSNPKIQFNLGNCEEISFEPKTFDLITSFEVIEHLKSPEKFLAEIKRVLKTDGMFILSTPNKKTYPSGNIFHVKEYSESELKQLLTKFFSHVEILYQNYSSTMQISKYGQLNDIISFPFQNSSPKNNQNSPLYFVIICLDKKIEQISNQLFLFDKNTLLLNSYPKLQNWVKILQRDLELQQQNFLTLQSEFDERSKWAQSLDEKLKQRSEQLYKLQSEFDERSKWAQSLDEKLKQRSEQLYKLQSEFDERSKWAQSLDEKLKQRSEQLYKLQSEFDERSKWAQSLDEKLKQRSEQLYKLQSEFDERSKWAQSLDEKLKQRSEQLYKLQSEFDEHSKWAQSLDEKLKQRSEQLYKLQSEFDERSKWAQSLDEKLKQRSEQLYKLQSEFDEHSKWAQSLDEKLKQRSEQLYKLQSEFDERSKWALELNDEINERKKQIVHFQNEVQKKDELLEQARTNLEQKDELLEQARTNLEQKDEQITHLQKDILEQSFELSVIKNSYIFKQMKNISSFIDKIAPVGSSRREICRLSTESCKIIKNQGLGGFTKATSLKINSINYSNRLKHKFQKPSIIDSTPNANQNTTTSSNLLLPPKTFTKDENLRSYLKFGFHNISLLETKPLISIIIPTFNAVNLLQQNLTSIEALSTYPNYEIIIVTNNLDKKSEMRKFLSTLKHRVYIFESEYSFSSINNFAVTKAMGDYLLFLNDDMQIISKNWLEALLKLALQKNVGAVGGKLLFPNGKLQEAGGIIWKNGNSWNYGRNKDPDNPMFNFVREVDYCSGSCLFIKKDLFEKIGRFDSRYKIAYAEDSDLCMKIKNLGLKILYQPLSSLIHYEGSTSGTDVNKGIKSNQIENQKIFYKKWKKELLQHGDDSQENSYFASNRKKGLHILYVDHYIPEIDKDAGSQTAFFTISVLSYMGHKVTFWPENLHKSEPYLTELQQRGIEVIYGHQNFEKFLKERGHIFSIAILCRPHIAINFIDALKQHAPYCKIIYEASDLYHVALQRESTIKQMKNKQIEAEKIKSLELYLMNKSNLIFFRTKKDCLTVLEQNKSYNVAALHLPPIYDGEIKSFDERNDLLYVGGFQHPPNADAVEYFITAIFPKILQKSPSIKFKIVGSKIPKKIKKLCSKSKNCEVLGYVMDLSKVLNDCRVMVAPLRYGAGVKGKVTECMSHSLPLVTTSIGAEGLDLDDKECLLIADTSYDFAEKTLLLYENRKLWNRISKNSKTFIENNFSPEQGKGLLDKVIKFLS